MKSLPLFALAALLLLGPASAADLDPEAVPARGAIVPAFGLHALSSKKVEDPPVYELDEHCGSRPGETTAVLLLFVDETGADDLSLANSWYKKYNKAGLEVLAVSTVREPDEFAKQVERSRLQFPVLDDMHGIVSHRFGVAAAPFSFLLNQECRVLGLSNRTLVADTEPLSAAVEAQVTGRFGQLGR